MAAEIAQLFLTGAGIGESYRVVLIRLTAGASTLVIVAIYPSLVFRRRLLLAPFALPKCIAMLSRTELLRRPKF